MQAFKYLKGKCKIMQSKRVDSQVEQFTHNVNAVYSRIDSNEIQYTRDILLYYPL